jgi:hypothetical protein
MQYDMSPYSPPPQIPRPTTLADPSTPHGDASQVNLSFFIQVRVQNPNHESLFLLQGSWTTSKASVMPWGGSPGAR